MSQQEEIRGLNVKFDADFSEFKKNLRSADKDINATQKNLKLMQESLKLEWNPAKFKQAQSEARKALEATEQKADLLRKRLAQMEAAGVTDATRDEYQYLSEQLLKTENSAKKLENTLKDLDKLQVKNMTKGVDKATESLEKASAATRGLSIAASAALAGLAALATTTIKTGDEIATMATQYDITTDAVQRFNYVALQTDVQSEDLYKGLVKVRAASSDLAVGVSSTATKALEQLNLSMDKFGGEEEQFYAVIDALSKMEDTTLRTSLANDIFGEKFAVNLLPMIEAGTIAINQYKAEFEALGYLNEEQVQSLAKMDEELNKLKTQYTNLALELGESLMPVVKELSDIATQKVLPILKELVGWFSSLDSNTQMVILSVLLLTAALSPMLSVAATASKSISTIITLLGKLNVAAITTTLSWAALAASMVALFAVIANWSKMNTVQKVVALLGALTAAAFSAAIAFGAMHSAWSMGIAAAAIVAGIAAVTVAIASAKKEAGKSSGSYGSYSGYSASSYSIPKVDTSSITNQSSSYIDNSNVVINIEKNDYMSENDIIKAVNKALKESKQSRR